MELDMKHPTCVPVHPQNIQAIGVSGAGLEADIGLWANHEVDIAIAIAVTGQDRLFWL